MSHLIRNVLEDTFQLVDDVVDGVDGIVAESVELARRVGRDARRMAGAVRDAVAEPQDLGEAEAAPPAHHPPAANGDPLAHVYAWNGVVANREARCAQCGATIPRGGDAFVGLSDDPTQPRAWLCPSCREAI